MRSPSPPEEYRITAKELAEEYERNQRLVVSIAYKCWKARRRNIPLDDFISAANLGFLEAARLYDRRRGVKYSSYASHWILKAIQEMIRNQSDFLGPKRPRPGDVCQKVQYGAGDDGKPLETTVPQPETEPSPDPRKFWRRVRSALSDREYKVLKMVYTEGKTYADVAKAVAISRERVRQVADRAKERIQRRFLESDLV